MTYLTPIAIAASGVIGILCKRYIMRPARMWALAHPNTLRARILLASTDGRYKGESAAANVIRDSGGDVR